MIRKMEKVLIRDYSKVDYPSIIKLWKETGIWNPQRDDNPESIEKCLVIGGKFLVMVDLSEKIIIGSSWLTFDGRRLYLHHFCIKPDYQLKGLGTKLVKASLQYVYTSGHQVKIEVHKENEIAVYLYTKFGFSPFNDYDVFMIRDVQNIPPENRLY